MIDVTDKVLNQPDQATSRWLSAVLKSSGALTRGSVKAVKIESGQGNWSENAILKLGYVAGSQGERPQSLFLKMVDAGSPDDGEFFDDSEVTYYTRDYVALANAPLLRCYHAAYANEERRYHLLLQDVSATHVQARLKTPSLAYGLALAEGLAVLHAHWWGAERLAQAGAKIHDPDHIRRFVAIAEPGLGHILALFQSELKAEWPAKLHALFARHPQTMIARTKDANGFTLIHGDVGETNILVPHEGSQPLYIIDRQPFNWSLTTWLGVYDLTYAMVMGWAVETRRELEKQVLRRYYEVLLDNGVKNYSWDQLWDDYRLSAAMGVYIATEYCRGGINERLTFVWLPYLQRSLTAIDDLQADSLWG